MGNIKEINVKKLIIFSRIWSILKSLIKTDKRSSKKIDIYHIGYITVKDSYYVKINRVNPLYLIISEAGEYIKEKNGSKYLVSDSANENNEVLKKYNELWEEIKKWDWDHKWW